MSIFQLVGFGLVVTCITVLVRQLKSEIAIYIPIIAGIIIFMMMANSIYSVLKLLQNMSDKLNLGNSYLSLILKMIGIAFLSEFTADICRDSGETAIANKIEFAGKIIILVLAVPIITALLEMILKLLR